MKFEQRIVCVDRVAEKYTVQHMSETFFTNSDSRASYRVGILFLQTQHRLTVFYYITV